MHNKQCGRRVRPTRYAPARRPSVTLTFDRLTLKLVCQSHLSWGTLIPKFGDARPLGSRIIRFVRDGQTDRQKQRLLPLPYGRVHNKRLNYH